MDKLSVHVLKSAVYNLQDGDGVCAPALKQGLVNHA